MKSKVPRAAAGLAVAAWIAVASSGVAPLAAAHPQSGGEGTPTGTLGKPRITDDPASDGWSSEVYARRIDKTLKKCAKYCGSHEELELEEIEHLVAPGFECGPLRPAELAVAFEDATATVRRGRGDGGTDARRFGGAAGLRDALAELLAPCAGARERRFEVKTIRVDPDASPPSSYVRVEIFARFEARSIQQVLEWTCSWHLPEGGEPGLLLGIETGDFEEVEARAPDATLFADCTKHVLGGNESFAAQLVPGSEDWLATMDLRMGYNARGHQGVAIADVDGDGLEDVYVCQAGGLPNKLFRHLPDGTVRDVSAEAGVDYLELTHSALFLDLDRDGDRDLVLGTGFDLIALENDGAGRFTFKTRTPAGRVTLSLAAADVDSDGDVDVYACVFHPQSADPGSIAHPVPLHDATNGGRNVLFRNDIVSGGEWAFTDATDELGLDENNSRFSYAAAFEDYDDDGDPDLYVANDFGRNNLYRNDGGRFRDVAGEAGVEDRSFGMSAAFGDCDRDGRMDLYVGNMFSSAGNRVTYQRSFKPGIDPGLLETYRYLARGNSLFVNRGGGRFDDVSVESGTTMGRWAWGSIFVDANNDGFEDVYVCNGYLTNSEPDDL